MSQVKPLPSKTLFQRSRMLHTWLFAIPMFGVLLTSTPAFAAEDLIEWIGYPLMLIGVLGRTWCTMYVGGRKNDQLVDQGPYSLVRNPLYVFSFIGIAGAGAGASTGMLTAAVLGMLAFALYYPSIVQREEAFLLSRFGDAYISYCCRVPRWIPNLSLWHSPREITVQPKLVWKTFLDAAWFLAVLPVFELLEELHQAGFLPCLLRIY
jgi:protein-S-isoprenylcysteine O-methyltransferase Ste14